MSGLAKKLGPIGAAAALLATAALPALHAPAHAAGGVQLVMFTNMQASEGKVLQQISDQWAIKTGNTVKVIVNTSGGFQQFATLARTGKGPDLEIGIPADNIGTFKAGGLLAPVPLGIWDPSNYVAGALQAVSFQGKQYAVPFDVDTYTLVYNKKLVPTPPTTMDQLIQMASKFPNTKGQNYGFLFDPTNLYYSYAYIRAAGGYIFQSNGSSLNTTNIGLGNAGAIKAYQLFADLVQKYKLIPSDIQNSSIPGSLFQSGKLAMFIDGDWDIAANEKALGTSFGAAPLPTFDGQPAHPFAGEQVGFVSNYSHHQALAWNLMKYLAPIFPFQDFQTAGRIPALKSALNNPAIAKSPIYSVYAKSTIAGDPLPNVPEMQAVWAPASNNIALVLEGKSTPAQAAADMVAQIKKGILQQQG